MNQRKILPNGIIDSLNYLYDGKGNVSAVIDANQAVVATYSMTASGSYSLYIPIIDNQLRSLSATGHYEKKSEWSDALLFFLWGLSIAGYGLCFLAALDLIEKLFGRRPLDEKSFVGFLIGSLLILLNKKDGRSKE